MHPKKLENIISLTEAERYELFIRDVVQHEQIWVLSTNDGYVMFKDHEGDVIFPVWPYKETAEICMFEEHKDLGAIPVEIAFEAFVNKCIPDMIEKDVLFGVFLDKAQKALAIYGENLLEDLVNEYEEIFGS